MPDINAAQKTETAYLSNRLESNVFIFNRVLIILVISGAGFLIRNYLKFLFVYDIAVIYFIVYAVSTVSTLLTRILLAVAFFRNDNRRTNLLIIFSCVIIFAALVLISVLDSVSIKEYKYVNEQNLTAYIFGIILIGFVLRIDWKTTSVLFSCGMFLFIILYHHFSYTEITFQTHLPLLIINILSVYFSFIRERYYLSIFTDKSFYQNQSLHDSLTQLYNRRYFSSFIRDCFILLKTQAVPFCCIFVDIDHFKSLNDDFGHDAGDEVLVEISRLLRHESRESDTVIRFGGEEFIIILQNTRLNEAVKIAERLRKAVEIIQISIIDREITASFGITEALSDDDENSLVKRADELLYTAKRKGRNCCRYKTDEL